MICTFIWYLGMNLRIPLHDKKNRYKLYSPVHIEFIWNLICVIWEVEKEFRFLSGKVQLSSHHLLLRVVIHIHNPRYQES